MRNYTYIFYDPSREEPIYVGKGSGRRDTRHFTRTDKHPFVQRLQLMKKNHISPIVHRIPTTTEEFAFMLETGLIKLIGRKDLGTGPLLNRMPGGEMPPNSTGLKRTAEQIERNRQAQLKSYRNTDRAKKISESMKGNQNGRRHGP